MNPFLLARINQFLGLRIKTDYDKVFCSWKVEFLFIVWIDSSKVRFHFIALGTNGSIFHWEKDKHSPRFPVYTRFQFRGHPKCGVVGNMFTFSRKSSKDLTPCHDFVAFPNTWVFTKLFLWIDQSASIPIHKVSEQWETARNLGRHSNTLGPIFI